MTILVQVLVPYNTSFRPRILQIGVCPSFCKNTRGPRILQIGMRSKFCKISTSGRLILQISLHVPSDYPRATSLPPKTTKLAAWRHAVTVCWLPHVGVLAPSCRCAGSLMSLPPATSTVQYEHYIYRSRNRRVHSPTSTNTSSTPHSVHPSLRYHRSQDTTSAIATICYTVCVSVTLRTLLRRYQLQRENTIITTTTSPSWRAL